MEKSQNYTNFSGSYGYQPFTPYENFDPNLADNAFDPMYQYEQGYMYYRYLTQAMEYKIKCKEYEKVANKENRNDRRID